MVKLVSSLACSGATVRYGDDGGQGVGVVLTHGAGMDHAMWDVQADALTSAGYRMIVWDMRGHGQSVMEPGVRFAVSDALDDLSALLDAVGLAAAVLVGHSLGGNLSQAFVRRHPGRTSGLIIVDSTWNAGPLSAGERLGLRLAAPMLAVIPTAWLPGLMARTSAVSPEAIAQTRSVLSRMPRGTFVDVMRAGVSLVSPDASYRTPVPLGLIRGDRDRTGNIATAMPRWANTEGVQEQVIPDAGHVVTLDAPEATSQALLQTLEEWNLKDHRVGDRGAQ